MGGSPGNTIEHGARAPAGRHTYFLCLRRQNSIPPGSHAGAFGPRVPSVTQTARVSRPTGLRIFVALLSQGFRPGLTHSAPLGLESACSSPTRVPHRRPLRLRPQSLKDLARCMSPVEIQNDPLPTSSAPCAL